MYIYKYIYTIIILCYVHTQLTQLIGAVSPPWNDFLYTYSERWDKHN